MDEKEGVEKDKITVLLDLLSVGGHLSLDDLFVSEIWCLKVSGFESQLHQFQALRAWTNHSVPQSGHL